MPIYEYRCTKGHTFEVIQSMSDDPVASCELCEEPVERVFHPVAVHFKGSGFYTTDYGRKKSGTGGNGTRKGESGSGESGSGETASAASDSSSSSSSSSSSASDD